MDSRAVSKAIQDRIRPLLRSRGFSAFTARSAWRYTGRRVDVVNFQSFNSHDAERLGCTTFSFAINLGCTFADVPSCIVRRRTAASEPQPRPEEYECVLRDRLHRGYRRKWFGDQREVWFVDADGRNLHRVMTDAHRVLERDGLPWFDRFPDHLAVLDVLTSRRPDGRGASVVGAPGSPVHNYFVGHFALVAGELALARSALEAALDSGRFEAQRPELEAAIERTT